MAEASSVNISSGKSPFRVPWCQPIRRMKTEPIRRMKTDQLHHGNQCLPSPKLEPTPRSPCSPSASRVGTCKCLKYCNQQVTVVCGHEPIANPTESIADLKTEILEHCRYALGVILVGDMNVHERSWLKYSNGISAEGRKLHEVSADLGLRQLVHAPTRGDYLLDLVLSNLEDVTCTVTPKIADHNGVVVKLKLSVPTSCSVKRTVWSFNKADWEQLFSALENKD